MRASFRASGFADRRPCWLCVACASSLVVGGLLGAQGCSAYDSHLLEHQRGGSAVPGTQRGAGDAAARGSARDAQTGAMLDAAITRRDASSDAGGAGAACGDAGIDCCPADPHKTSPGQCGCGLADTDLDGDGTADCRDGCPADPAKIAPGICGCGGSDADSDGDGSPSCMDGCPDDANKTAPGMCGCGVADTDTDGDKVADCVDGCPADATKTVRGMCGCGVADTDTDGDKVADCVDGCPADPAKAEPGICGCGNPDSDQGATISCAGLRNALVHRYRFDGTGTAAVDSRGGQNGTVVNTQLGGAGKLDLAGGTSSQYVDLPNGLVSALTDATFEIWVTWNGGSAWQRIFDFGDNSNATEGNQGTGKSYLFLTPSNGSALRVAYSRNGSASETGITASGVLATGGMHHLAVVLDDSNNRMLLYLDGALSGSVAISASLSGIHDINNWLGHSQFSGDPDLAGSLHEFRIYNAALSAAQIGFSVAAGPDPAFLADF